MAILLVQLVTRSQRRSSAGISNTIALRKLGTRNCPCLNRFLSLKAPPLAAGIFYFAQRARPSLCEPSAGAPGYDAVQPCLARGSAPRRRGDGEGQRSPAHG